MIRFVCTLFAGCLLIGSAFASDEEDIEALIQKFEQVVTAGDAAAAGMMYTEDAAMFPPASPPVEGREAIQGLWQSFIDGGVVSLDLNATEVRASGDLAYDIGTFALAIKTESGEVPATGKYIVVWLKGEDGIWRLHRDIWNDDEMQE